VEKMENQWKIIRKASDCNKQRLTGGQKAAGSNPVAPTKKDKPVSVEK